MTPNCHWTTSPLWESWAATPAARRFDGTPAVPAFTVRGGQPLGHAAAVGRGTNEISVTLSQVNGLGAEAPSQVHPTPVAAPRRRRKRLTTRPDREPSLTVQRGIR